MTTEEPLLLGAPNVTMDPFTKDLIMNWSVLGERSMETIAEARIAPHELLHFLRQAQDAGLNVLYDVGMQIAWGPCSTCQNTHLVETPGTGGRIRKTRCPDCAAPSQWPDGPPVPFKDWPRYGEAHTATRINREEES
jgi:hypothetical protein